MAFEVNWLAAESKRCKDGVHISHAIPLQGAYKLSQKRLSCDPVALGSGRNTDCLWPAVQEWGLFLGNLHRKEEYIRCAVWILTGTKSWSLLIFIQILLILCMSVTGTVRNKIARVHWVHRVKMLHLNYRLISCLLILCPFKRMKWQFAC